MPLLLVLLSCPGDLQGCHVLMAGLLAFRGSGQRSAAQFNSAGMRMSQPCWCLSPDDLLLLPCLAMQEAAHKASKELDPVAGQIGAVNTLVRQQDGSFKGYNTGVHYMLGA